MNASEGDSGLDALCKTFAGKRIFLTGGTGFFGKSLLSLLTRGFLPETEFWILSRDPRRFLADYPGFSSLSRVRWLAGDVRDFDFPREEFPLVFHAAAPAVTTLPPGEMASIIGDGTRRVLEFARRCGAEKLLLTSSGAVYGPQPPELERLPEDFPCRPATEYGIAKLDAEKRCADSGIFTLLPRCFAFAGPYLNREIHFAFGNFLRDALAGNPVEIRGDGTPYRSYLYADDLIEWLFVILARGENARPYNVGSDRAVSLRELAELCRSVLKSPAPVNIRCRPAPGTAPSRYVPSILRARTELGLQVRVPLDEAVRRSAFR